MVLNLNFLSIVRRKTNRLLWTCSNTVQLNEISIILEQNSILLKAIISFELNLKNKVVLNSDNKNFLNSSLRMEKLENILMVDQILQGSARGGGIAKIPPPEIENFQNTPPWVLRFSGDPPPSGLAKRGRFLPENGQFSRKFGHFVGHFR